jgi:hypothetical protein
MGTEIKANNSYQQNMVDIITTNNESNLQIVEMVCDWMHRYWGEDRHSCENIAFGINVMRQLKNTFLKKAIKIVEHHLPINAIVFDKAQGKYLVTNNKKELKVKSVCDMYQDRLKNEWMEQKDKLTSLSSFKIKGAKDKEVKDMTVNEVMEARTKGMKSGATWAKNMFKLGMTAKDLHDIISLEAKQCQASEVSGFLKEAASGG